VYDFQRWTSIIRYSREELARTWRSIETLARAEGLEAHARSVAIRQKGNNRRRRKSEA
jgi:histidinol dehydrogenase